MCELCEQVAERLHGEHDQAEAVAELTASEVEIARINADRDITLARIAAGTEKAAVAAETDAELVAAQTEAATLGEVVDALTPDPEPAPAAPVVVAVDDQADEPDPVDLPPVEPEHGEPKEKPRPKGFF